MNQESRVYQLIEATFIAFIAKLLVETVIFPWLKRQQQTAGFPPSAGGCHC